MGSGLDHAPSNHGGGGASAQGSGGSVGRPDVRIRQWVLSLPIQVRLLCAFKPEALTAVVRELTRAVFAYRGGGRGSWDSATRAAGP